MRTVAMAMLLVGINTAVRLILEELGDRGSEPPKVQCHHCDYYLYGKIVGLHRGICSYSRCGQNYSGGLKTVVLKRELV